MDDKAAKRRLMLAAAAAAAATAGAGVAWWRSRAPASPAAPALAEAASAASPASASAGAAAGLAAPWDRQFERPDGGALALATYRGQPLVLNFWATWCPPCVREMPLLDRFAREYAPRGWRVVGLAADNATAVREFLARAPVSYPTALIGFDGIELSRELGNTKGGLPFTVLFDRSGKVFQRKLGETSFDELTNWAELLPKASN
jgi:thiol-disulfide isomerase/thioredoxin